MTRIRHLLERAPVTSPPPTEVPDTGVSLEDEDEMLYYDELTVKELKTDLSRRGLAVSGTKATLVARLEEDDA